MNSAAAHNYENQVNTRKRVADHGEVYTAKREVDAMLDLVKHETDRIESRFLEPACGTGNFLAEVLDRKLAVVTSRYAKSEAEWDRYAIIAASSLYGIDILQDNIEKCRDRLFKPFEKCRDEVKYAALELFVKGVKVAVIKAKFGIDRATAYRWRKAVNTGAAEEVRHPTQ